MTDSRGRRRWHRRAIGLWVGGAVALMALAAEGYLARSPWEPAARDIDASVKRAQTLALADSGLRSQALTYRASFVDPKRWFLPFVKPFTLRSRVGPQSIFPTVAAMVDVPFERLGGYAGVRLLSILGVIGLTLVVGARAGLRGDVLWPLVLIFGTPMWYYALGSTGPPIAVLVAMGAVVLSVNPDRMLLAGLLLGLSSTVRDETLALAPGIALVHLVRRRTVLPVLAFVVAAVVPVVAVSLLDSWVYDRPPAAHLLHALKGAWFADLPVGAVPVLETMTARQRFDAVFVYWFDGRNAAHVLAMAAAAIVAVIVRWRWRSYWGTLPLLLLVGVDAVRDAASLWDAPRRLAGLIRLAPFVVFALLPAPAVSRTLARHRTRALLIAAVFMVVAVLTTNTTGGKALGPRLLLPAWPLLAFAAWAGLRQHAASWRAAAVHRVVTASGAVLLLLSFAIATVFVLPAFRAVEQEATDAARYVFSAPETVVVIGSPFAIDAAIASYERKAVMLAESPEDTRDIAGRLAATRVRSLLAVRRDDRQDLAPSFEGYGLSDERRFGRWIVQRWAR